MTTAAAAELYEAQHVTEHMGRKVAIFYPNGASIESLPVIYGFNNGGNPGWMEAVLLSQDGKCLGGHLCSSEAYMPHDLGILEGTRPDRHETFRAHYPSGYRMEFVGYGAIANHAGLQAAFKAHEDKQASDATQSNHAE
jgi:hypothetical protein